MRTLYWYLHFIITLIMKTPDMYRLKKIKGSTPEKEFLAEANRIAGAWAFKQAKASGATFNIVGAENIPEDEAVLFVSNHQSNFDIAILLGFIKKPKGFIAKTELLKIPLLRTWMSFIGCTFMDRKDIKKAAQAITDGINKLKAGHSMVVFPEGTRSKSNKPGEFKAGSFKLATKSKATVVPVTISGSYKIMEANGNKIKPAEVFVTVHPPIFTRDLCKEELAALPELVRNTVVSSLTKD